MVGLISNSSPLCNTLGSCGARYSASDAFLGGVLHLCNALFDLAIGCWRSYSQRAEREYNDGVDPHISCEAVLPMNRQRLYVNGKFREAESTSFDKTCERQMAAPKMYLGRRAGQRIWPLEFVRSFDHLAH